MPCRTNGFACNEASLALSGADITDYGTDPCELYGRAKTKELALLANVRLRSECEALRAHEDWARRA